jgi:hypothetical protein
MALEDTIKELDLMRKCYFQNFVSEISSVHQKCYDYKKFHSNQENTVHEIMQDLNLLKNHFDSLPYDEIKGNLDFAPVFMTKYLLDIFSSQVQEYLLDPSEENYWAVGECKKAFGPRLRRFEINIGSKQLELEEEYGYNDYKFEVTSPEKNKFIRDFKDCARSQ